MRTGVYLVGERQHAVLDLEQTLVVDTSVDRIPGRLAAVKGRITVNGSSIYVLWKGGDVVRRAVTLIPPPQSPKDMVTKRNVSIP